MAQEIMCIILYLVRSKKNIADKIHLLHDMHSMNKTAWSLKQIGTKTRIIIWWWKALRMECHAYVKSPLLHAYLLLRNINLDTRCFLKFSWHKIYWSVYFYLYSDKAESHFLSDITQAFFLILVWTLTPCPAPRGPPARCLSGVTGSA